MNNDDMNSYLAYLLILLETTYDLKDRKNIEFVIDSLLNS